jgi:hypothetical protein
MHRWEVRATLAASSTCAAPMWSRKDAVPSRPRPATTTKNARNNDHTRTTQGAAHEAKPAQRKPEDANTCTSRRAPTGSTKIGHASHTQQAQNNPGQARDTRSDGIGSDSAEASGGLLLKYKASEYLKFVPNIRYSKIF